MLEMRGHVKRKLVPVVLSAGDVPEKGAVVTTTEGQDVGAVTSAVRSPTLGVPVALAMVKYAHAKTGVAVRVGDATGSVVERPV